MQRAPQHFGQNFRLLPIWPECDDQLGEGSTESCRRFLAGEFDLCRQDEHRLVDNRPRTGKIKSDYIWPTGPLQNDFRPLRDPRSAFLDTA
jgi:hypothetical protein